MARKNTKNNGPDPAPEPEQTLIADQGPPPPSRESSGLPAQLPFPQFEIAARLENDSLVAIVIAHTEERLKEKMRAAVLESRKFAAQANELADQLKKIYDAAEIDEAFKAACFAFVAAGEKLQLRLVTVFSKTGFNIGDLSFVSQAKFETRVNSYSNLTAEHKQTLGEDAVQIRDELNRVKKEETTQAELARDARSRLSELPALERRARAKLAEYGLRQTAEGSKLLDALLHDLDREVDAMPVLRQLDI
jgi:hypothetical protein